MTKYYTVSEFRKNIKEALDLAAQGHTVYIERLGQLFEVKGVEQSSMEIKEL